MSTNNLKKINVRLKQKIDTLSKWQAIWETFVPLEGEIIVFEVPASDTAVEGEAARPQHITKTGDGVTTLKLLPWDSALAADVYAWAKTPTLKEHFANGVNSTIALTDDGKIKVDVSVSDVKVENAVTAEKASSLDETGVEQVKGIKVDEAGKADSATTATTASGLDDTGIAQVQGVKVNSATNADSADNANHATTASGLDETGIAQVQDIKVDNAGHADSADSATNADTAGKVVNKLTIAGEIFDGSAAIEITADEMRTHLGLSNALHFIGVKDSKPVSGNDGDVILVGTKEYVWSNGAWVELGDGDSHALKTVTISGEDGLTGGGSLEANRTIKHAIPTGASETNSGFYKVTTDKFGHVVGLTAVVKNDITGLGIPAQDTTYSNGTGISLEGTTFSLNATTIASLGLADTAIQDFSGNGIKKSGTNLVWDDTCEFVLDGGSSTVNIGVEQSQLG